jgi:hypothetical protein
VAIYKKDNFLYFFGIPCARAGGVKMMRVGEASIENKALYQYLTGFDTSGNPVWTTDNESLAINIVPPAVGELSVAWNDYLGKYTMMYLNDEPPGFGRGIEMRTSANLWGPWSDPVFVTSGGSYPCLYAPFMRESYQENNGQVVYFRMSRLCPGFNPYSTYWMKIELQKITPPTNLVVTKPACSESNYQVNLSWANSGTNWWVDISTDPNFGTFSNKPVSNLTSTAAPDGFSLNLVLTPETTYYWRIYYNVWGQWVNGSSFQVPKCGRIGDLNGDDLVNVIDLSMLLTRWSSSDTTADLNKNGIVDIFDLSMMLSNWGS